MAVFAACAGDQPARYCRAMNRETAPRIVLVGAIGALVLAANHFLFHWALLTEAYLRLMLD